MDMEVHASARHLHTSARKIRLVIDVIRGMRVAAAQAQLTFMKKAAAEPVLKLLNSAMANAAHNFKLATETLYIKKIVADEGPIIGRWQPRAFGRSAPIRKRTTHLSLVLDERAKRPVASKKTSTK